MLPVPIHIGRKHCRWPQESTPNAQVLLEPELLSRIWPKNIMPVRGAYVSGIVIAMLQLPFATDGKRPFYRCQYQILTANSTDWLVHLETLFDKTVTIIFIFQLKMKTSLASARLAHFDFIGAKCFNNYKHFVSQRFQSLHGDQSLMTKIPTTKTYGERETKSK